MKTLISTFLLLFACYGIHAQTIDQPQYDMPSFGCVVCETGNYNYQTGTKLGFGLGLVKPLNSKFEIHGNIGYNYWNHRVEALGIDNTRLGSFTKHRGYGNLTLGGRYNLWTFKNSNIFTGLNANLQFYANRVSINKGLSVEPNLGWSKNMNNGHQFYMALGFDQLLTSYNSSYKRYPNKFGLFIGLNLNVDNYKKKAPASGKTSN